MSKRYNGIVMILSVLTSVSITCIIVHSELFRWLRGLGQKINEKLGYWLQCPMCFGFWVGIIAGLFFGEAPIVNGLLSSLFSWSVYNIITAFGALGDYYTIAMQNIESNHLDSGEQDE